MIDIIEAGKFYNDCLKKVHESTLKDNILPENEIMNAKAQLMSRPHKGDRAVVGAFTLNGRDYMFEVGVARGDKSQDICHKVANRISNIIADSITKSVLLDL